MTSDVALLRAVNVVDTGNFPMSELRAMCKAAEFENARTYIPSGNALFHSRLDEQSIRMNLEQPLADCAGKPVGLQVRTADEMADVLGDNPFSEEPGNRLVAIFLDLAHAATALDEVTDKKAERLALGRRKTQVHCGEGVADSRLRISATKAGTARNMDTVTKLSSLAAK
jgi:uncharacterized protein (DUF1697 family)